MAYGIYEVVDSDNLICAKFNALIVLRDSAR